MAETSIRFGYAAIGWREPLSMVASAVGRLGFLGLEAFGITERLPEDEDLQSTLKSAGVRLISTYYVGSFVEKRRLSGELQAFRRSAVETKDLGGEFMVISGGRRREHESKDDWRTFIRTISHAAKIASDVNITLVFHPHFGTLVQDAQEIDEFVKSTDPRAIGLALDIAHLQKTCGDPRPILEKHIGRVEYVHFKDWNEKQSRFVELGKGNVPIRQVFDLLMESEYSGWIVVELDSALDPHSSALTNARYLSRELRASIKPTSRSDSDS